MKTKGFIKQTTTLANQIIGLDKKKNTFRLDGNGVWQLLSQKDLFQLIKAQKKLLNFKGLNEILNKNGFNSIHDCFYKEK